MSVGISINQGGQQLQTGAGVGALSVPSREEAGGTPATFRILTEASDNIALENGDLLRTG